MKLQEVTLLSSNINSLQQFYTHTLGLETIAHDKNAISFQAGESVLTFKQTANRQPYYHFAFNIPSNKIEEAAAWMRLKNLKLLPYLLRKIVHFEDWNAHSIYFYDPSGNIVEFIARHNLENETETEFHPSHVLNISEIGLPVTAVGQIYQQLRAKTGIEKYSGNLDNFCAAGDEEGLFIIVDQVIKKWIPVSKVAKCFPLQVHFSTAKGHFSLSVKEASVIELEEKNEANKI